MAECPIDSYRDVKYFLLFKAMSWLTNQAGESRAIELLLSEPEEKLDLPFSGVAEACKACGLRHPEGLCAELVHCAPLDRFLALAIHPDAKTSLHVRLAERTIVIEAETTEAIRRYLASWGAIERLAIGDP